MTLEEELLLSCYEELTTLDKEKQVYLVKEKSTGRILVKKKVLCPHPEIYTILQKEKFPGIPAIYEIIPDGENVILIEEYIHGCSLKTVLEQRGCFREEEATRIWKTLCDILKNLHHHEPMVIHRDIKPSNLMLSYEGNLYLIDFNASRLYVEGNHQDTELIGTYEYAAPEQYGFCQTDSRSDIYALGVTMNELLTGSYPNKRMPDGKLGRIIAKSTHMDPEQRYQTVEELEYDLNHEAGERKKFQSKKQYYPPGFRTGTWWKMLIAIIGYGFCAAVFLSMESQDAAGHMLTGVKLWYERITMLAGTFFIIFFHCNYLGILERTLKRFKRNPILFRCVQVVVTILWYIALIGMMVIVEDIIW